MRQRRSKGRVLNGILLLDKPHGDSSNAALQKVKRLYGARKAGHTGSLDPIATGLLPICFGEATKISAYLLDADKSYWVRIKLGVTTTTADSEGEVVETRPVTTPDADQLEAVLEGLRGTIDQIPPMYSALHHQGKRLYELARQGIEVERKPRTITIYRLESVSIDGDELELEVDCSKGTYVRSLVEDIGSALGCGAHVTALRRTAAGPFHANGMVTLDALYDRAEDLGHLDSLLLPIESALASWTRIQLSTDAAYYLKQGQAVTVPKAPTSGWVALFENNGVFLGVGQIQDDGRIAPRRLFNCSGAA